MSFPEWLRREREARGFNKKDLSLALGVSGNVVCVWEKGTTGPVDRQMVSLARVFEIPVEEVAEALGVLGQDSIGERIRRGRWALYLTRDELAGLVGSSPAMVTYWENNRFIPRKHVGQLEEILGVTICPPSRAPSGGPVAWLGSKARLVPQILPLLPNGRIYVEPFGGGGSVLFARHRSSQEIWNDLNADLANLFRVLRDDEDSLRLRDMVNLTLYSRAEYVQAAKWLADPDTKPIDRAWAFFVLMNQAFESREALTRTGVHAQSSWRNHTSGLNQWQRKVEWLGWWHERLDGVLIESQPAERVMQRYDGPDTVFYLDPPYVPSSRKRASGLYRHDMAEAGHERLIEQILGLQGSVVISGYAHPLYERLEVRGWRRIALGDQRWNGRELVWQNPRAQRQAPA